MTTKNPQDFVFKSILSPLSGQQMVIDVYLFYVVAFSMVK